MRFADQCVHVLDGFFGIDNGKIFNIKLKGITISTIQGKLTVKSASVELPPLPLGVHRPVVLPIGLMNIGSGPLRYALDLDALAKIQPELLETGAVAFQNESNNIGALKKVNFVIRFRPISLAPIAFPLHINVFDYFKQIQKISLQVTASPTAVLDPRALDAFFKVDVDLASIEGLIKDTDQGCYLSDDVLDFRGSHPHSKNERVIFLTNLAARECVQFWFDGLELTHNKRIDVFPNRGVLEPKGSVQLTFVYEQNESPVYWEGELSVAFRVIGDSEEEAGPVPISSRALELGSEEQMPSMRRVVGISGNQDQQDKDKVRRMFLRVKISTDLTVG